MEQNNQIILLNIGTELTQGEVQNTALKWIAQHLFEYGWSVHWQATLPDTQSTWDALFDLALAQKPSILLLTGGLGPTDDDRTRFFISQKLGRPLVHSSEAEAQIRARFEEIKRPCHESNLVQALLPEGATLLRNPVGTAPGFLIEHQGIKIICTPGVPYEMQTLFSLHLQPLIAQATNSQTFQISLHLQGIGESELSPILRTCPWPEHVEWSSLPTEKGVHVHLYGAPSPEILQNAQEAFRLSLGAFADSVASWEGLELPQVLQQKLQARKQTLCVAESCTGGLLGSILTELPGSSQFFQGGLIAYQKQLKQDHLFVPPQVLETYGEVSAETVHHMALGAQKQYLSDWALAISGIAGPDGGTPEKPVGLVWMAIAHPNGSVETFSKKFFGTRNQIRMKCVYWLMDQLRKALG